MVNPDHDLHLDLLSTLKRAQDFPFTVVGAVLVVIVNRAFQALTNTDTISYKKQKRESEKKKSESDDNGKVSCPLSCGKRESVFFIILSPNILLLLLLLSRRAEQKGVVLMLFQVRTGFLLPYQRQGKRRHEQKKQSAIIQPTP